MTYASATYPLTGLSKAFDTGILLGSETVKSTALSTRAKIAAPAYAKVYEEIRELVEQTLGVAVESFVG